MINFYISKTKFFLPLFLLIAIDVNAQQNANSVEVNLQRSINTFTANGNPLQGDAYGGEIIFHYNANKSKRKWSSDLGIASIDLIANYKRMHSITLKSNPVERDFGDSYALLTGVTLPIFSVSKATVSFAPAFGVVHAGESWFSNQNPIVGSKLNFALKAALKLDVPVSEKSAIGANIDVLHYSNGGARVPNNGMNVVNVGLSFKRYFDNRNEAKVIASSVFEEPKHTFDLAIGYGRRGVYQSKEGLYRTALYGGYNYRLKSYLAMGVGVDAVYYHTVYDPNRNLETYQSNASSFKPWRVGTAIGPDLWMGKLAVMLKYGYYIYYDSLKPINTYWTGGAKYRLTNYLALQSKIYIHNTEADFIGFGLMFTK
jgi:hypothetical protein